MSTLYLGHIAKRRPCQMNTAFFDNVKHTQKKKVFDAHRTHIQKSKITQLKLTEHIRGNRDRFLFEMF